MPQPRAAFTIPEFCEAHRFSQAKYYEMKREGWGPAEMSVGRRRLISYEAASVWRREREVETASSTNDDLAWADEIIGSGRETPREIRRDSADLDAHARGPPDAAV